MEFLPPASNSEYFNDLVLDLVERAAVVASSFDSQVKCDYQRLCILTEALVA
jgi:hypothetical protein